MHARSRLLMAVLLLGLSACEFDEHLVAPSAKQIVVHSVLNPAAEQYVVLVEELLTGRVDINTDEPFRDVDPIASGSGIPVADAHVVIYNAAGDSAVGTEDLLSSRSTGVYRFFNADGTDPAALRIVPGAQYFLKVETPSGTVVTGSTVIPQAAGADPGATIQFNRDTDTLRLTWAPSGGAKTYLIRVNSPRGPYHIFTDSTDIRLPGSLRDFFNERLPSVFVPGFTQELLVAAIDTNFYDYYRSQNNPFTGSGLINKLQGGAGLFGSFVPVAPRTIVTIANQEQPVEGEYFATVAFASSAPNRVTLYIDSQRGNQATLTGNYDRQTSIEGGGVLGFQNGTTVSLAFLRENLASDTLMTFSGTRFGGDSIVGEIPATAERIVYRKQ
jgi:hypothetical protein